MNRTADLGKVRGSIWYWGDGIFGISTEGAIFPGSGVAEAFIEDKYLNTKSGGVYSCVRSGDPSTAEWVFAGSFNIAANFINSLDSNSTTSGLTARMGKVLNDKINGMGAYPNTIVTKCTEPAKTVVLEVENIEGTITIETEDAGTGVYEVTAEENATKKSVNISVGTAIGLSGEGAVVKRIDSTGVIYSYSLRNENYEEIEGGASSIWEAIVGLLLNFQRGSLINDGTDKYRTAMLSMDIAGQREGVFPIGHDKAIYHDIQRNLTVNDMLESLEVGLRNVVNMFSDAQVDAINSGITSRRLSDIENAITSITGRVGHLETAISTLASALTSLRILEEGAYEAANTLNFTRSKITYNNNTFTKSGRI